VGLIRSDGRYLYVVFRLCYKNTKNVPAGANIKLMRSQLAFTSSHLKESRNPYNKTCTSANSTRRHVARTRGF